MTVLLGHPHGPRVPWKRPSSDFKPVLPVLGTGLVNWNNGIVGIKDKPRTIKTACERNVGQFQKGESAKKNP